jgi:AraC-like DNA-binding protein
MQGWRMGAIPHPDSTPILSSVDFDDITIEKASGRANRVRFIDPPPGNRYDYGDTMRFEFLFNPQPGQFYIDFSLCSEKFTGNRSDRFGAFDSAANYVYSIWHQPERYVYKSRKKDPAWALVEKDTLREEPPSRAFILEKYIMKRGLGRAEAWFRVLPCMTGGRWTLDAYLVKIEGAQKQAIPSIAFSIGPPKVLSAGCMILLLAGMLLAGLTAVILVRRTAARRKREKEDFPESWKRMARQAEAYLNEHFSDSDLNSQAIADHLKTSERNIRKIYGQVKGKPLFQHLREIRLQRAGELLKTTDQAVSQIAYDVGFSDPVIFQRNFKKMFGSTPTEYRNQK